MGKDPSKLPAMETPRADTAGCSKGQDTLFLIDSLASKDPRKVTDALRHLEDVAREAPLSLVSAMPILVQLFSDSSTEVSKNVLKLLQALGRSKSLKVSRIPADFPDGAQSLCYDVAKDLLNADDLDAALPLLLLLLQYPADDLARTWDIHRTLGDLGQQSSLALPILARHMLFPVWSVCYSASLALHAISPAQATRRLTDGLNHPDPVIRCNAVECLACWGEINGGNVKKVGSLLQDEEAIVRSAAADALGQSSSAGPSVGASLSRLLKDPDPFVRISAAGSILRLDPANECAFQTLSCLGRANQVQLRRRVFATLRSINNLQATGFMALLVQGLADAEEEDIPNEAAFCLGQIGEPAVPFLLKILSEKHLPAHFWAIIALNQIKPPVRAAFPLLLEILRNWSIYEDLANSNNSVPTHVFGALAGTRGAALEAISGLVGRGDSDVIPFFISALRWSSESCRRCAAEGLGRIGDNAKNVVSALRKAMKDECEEVR